MTQTVLHTHCPYLFRMAQVPLHQQRQQLTANLCLFQPGQLLCHLRTRDVSGVNNSLLCVPSAVCNKLSAIHIDNSSSRRTLYSTCVPQISSGLATGLINKLAALCLRLMTAHTLPLASCCKDDNLLFHHSARVYKSVAVSGFQVIVSLQSPYNEPAKMQQYLQ